MNDAYIYDARGNGGGQICPNLTGDHENRITDYSAVVVVSRTQAAAGGTRGGDRTDNPYPLRRGLNQGKPHCDKENRT